MSAPLNRRFCVAPMMRHSHRAARAWWRFLCPGALLYTEMMVPDAVLRGDRLQRELDENGRVDEVDDVDEVNDVDGADKVNGVDDVDDGDNGGGKRGGVALQLGGCDPKKMAAAARVAERVGFAEVNINCGCPSGRVRQAEFGAVLMTRPEVVADMVRAMKDAVDIAVTVKCRIAVDEMDPEAGLSRFAAAVAGAGADALIVHARKAWLNGLSPAQNRGVPPLNHGRVRRLKAELPELPMVINGGLHTVADCRRELQFVDGAMTGRAVMRNPMLLTEASEQIFGAKSIPTRREALARGAALAVARPGDWRRTLMTMAGLAHGMKRAQDFRRHLAFMQPAHEREKAKWTDAGPEFVGGGNGGFFPGLYAALSDD